jgi:hypothetical protein
MMTRYEVQRWARWIPRFCIDCVVKAMHTVVIRDMQLQLACAPLGDRSNQTNDDWILRVHKHEAAPE